MKYAYLFVFVVLWFCSPNSWSEPAFDELSISRLNQQIKNNIVTYQQVAQYYLNRIEHYNSRLNAVISVNPNAISQAKAADDAFKNGKLLGPLHGVPVLIKDNIDTSFLPTTGGSLALINNRPKQNADVVQQLLDAGAIILGKTNLSELANFKSTKSRSGYSGVGGQTANPYNLAMTPCGSSSGSAVSIAANLALVTLGTETDGSILCPSAFNGVVGFKPTLKHISQRGVIPIAHSQDTVGPIGRTVADVASVYQVLSKRYVKADAATSLAKKRIGVITMLNGFNQYGEAEFRWVLKTLKQQGAEVIENIPFEHIEQVYQSEFEILKYEFKQGMDDYLAKQTSEKQISNLTELAAYYKTQDDAHELLTLAIETTSKPRYELAKSTIDKHAKAQLKTIFEKYQLDAIIAPTTGAPWRIDPINGDRFSGSSTTLAAVSGFPSLTLPIGMKHGLPLAVSLFTLSGDDSELLYLAAEVEKLMPKRIPPTL